jgi:hypothetical protein
MSQPSLDGKTFALASSSASHVNTNGPTVFRYHESEGVIWAEYSGDTVVIGRCIGARNDDTLAISFVHRNINGDTVKGEARSEIRSLNDGRLHLAETFIDPNGNSATSECTEIR